MQCFSFKDVCNVVAFKISAILLVTLLFVFYFLVRFSELFVGCFDLEK